MAMSTIAIPPRKYATELMLVFEFSALLDIMNSFQRAAVRPASFADRMK
jgi:hypothetical protein